MSAKLAQLFRELYQLKVTLRTGWLDRGLAAEQTESVADHSLLTVYIAWIVACDDTTLDQHRVLEIAAIHDLAEALIGDETPYTADEIPRDDPEALREFFSVRHIRSAERKAVKRKTEAAAMERILESLPERSATLVRERWDEYEQQQTREAQFVKQVDILEAFLQSREYLKTYPDLPVDGFRQQALQEVTHPSLCEIRDARLREEEDQLSL